MEMIRVRSSAINAVGYDPVTAQMQITFKEGHTYTFCGYRSTYLTACLRQPPRALITTAISETDITADSALSALHYVRNVYRLTSGY
jgi:hypothetical protein